MAYALFSVFNLLSNYQKFSTCYQIICDLFMAYALFRRVSWAIQCNIHVSWTAGHSTAQGADAAGNATCDGGAAATGQGQYGPY